MKSVDAWKQACDHIRKARRMERDIVTLMSVLARRAAWTCSSCGVEKAFSMAQWAVEGRRSWTTDALETDELKLLVDRNDDEEAELFDEAQRCWKDAGYGLPRKPYAKRLDCGLSGSPGLKKTTKHVFFKSRNQLGSNVDVQK